jgi:hypothetical protein
MATELTKEIQKNLCRYLLLHGAEMVAENESCGTYSEMDVVAIRKTGMVAEYEVKISRSDFLADKKKSKWNYFELVTDGCPNYFYYVCPKDLISENEIPKYAGLYYYEDGIFTIVKNPRRLNAKPRATERMYKKLLRGYCCRKYLGFAMLTYLNKENENNNRIVRGELILGKQSKLSEKQNEEVGK